MLSIIRFAFFFNLKRVLFTSVLLLIFIHLQAQDQPRYIFINTWTKWSAGKPSSFNQQVINQIKKEIDAPENDKLHLGISFNFDYLHYDLDSVGKSLENFMALSQAAKVPVLINLDGVNWWGGRPDLWNWWDPDKAGYNPENRKNVEWTGWHDSLAIKVAWRNWGTQLRVLPPPNLSSPKVIAAHIKALQKLIPRIVKWYQALPEDQKYLLGGVKVGWEASIGVNAYYYKEGNRYFEKLPDDPSLDPKESFRAEGGLFGGLTPLGYAAVKTAGIKEQGKITRMDVAEVVHKFLNTLSHSVYHQGLPKIKIYTHQGGTFKPWNKHLPFSVAANDYSRPGWSFYNTDPADAGNLGDVLDRRDNTGWAAVEWWWPGSNKMEWVYNLNRTLTYRNCQFLTIYNWDGMLEKNREGILAVQEVIKHWQE